MNPNLHEDALHIVTSAIDAVKPDAAVRRALQGATFPGRVFLVAVGKAGWQMAHAALQCLPTPPAQGIVVTKYGHVSTDLPDIVHKPGKAGAGGAAAAARKQKSKRSGKHH